MICPKCKAKMQQKQGFILTDYKTWGSFKICKAIGVKKEYEQVLDEQGQPVLYKSGLKKGMEKLTPVITQSDEAIDLYETELQLNRYRLFFENYGFPISRIQVQAIIRDGNTSIAKSRGIHKNLMVIDIKKLPDTEVIAFYGKLIDEVNAAFKDGYARKCNDWETWGGTRCKSYCEVKHACDMMGNYDQKAA